MKMKRILRAREFKFKTVMCKQAREKKYAKKKYLKKKQWIFRVSYYIYF